MEYMPRKYPWHDFRRPGHYLFTLKAAASCRERFVTIDGEGNVHDTPLGALVRRQWDELMEETKGLLKTHAFQLMPDHLHAEVEVLARLPKTIGKYIARFKGLATGRARCKLGFPHDVPLWEPSYDWRLKLSREKIEIARAYVENNPKQYALKRQANASFGKVATIDHPVLPLYWPDITAQQPPLVWTGYGNAQLLDCKIWELRVSRRATPSDVKALTEKALARAQAEAVCISPAISPGEKEVFRSVVLAGGSAILLATMPLTQRYHPASWAMEAFAAGRLLVLSPVSEEKRNNMLSRVLAEHLNACAALIASRSGYGPEGSAPNRGVP